MSTDKSDNLILVCLSLWEPIWPLRVRTFLEDILNGSHFSKGLFGFVPSTHPHCVCWGPDTPVNTSVRTPGHECPHLEETRWCVWSCCTSICTYTKIVTRRTLSGLVLHLCWTTHTHKHCIYSLSFHSCKCKKRHLGLASRSEHIGKIFSTFLYIFENQQIYDC